MFRYVMRLSVPELTEFMKKNHGTRAAYANSGYGTPFDGSFARSANAFESSPFDGLTAPPNPPFNSRDTGSRLTEIPRRIVRGRARRPIARRAPVESAPEPVPPDRAKDDRHRRDDAEVQD